MSKQKKVLMVPVIMMVAVSMFLFSCKGKIAEPEEGAFNLLKTYLTTNNLDLTDILTDWIIDASNVAGSEGDFYIMDIRSAADFALGHITGAVNSSLANILTDAANSGGKPIVVACYTGQSAAHAVVALRLSGEDDAKVLKFGMSSWNADFDKWTANISSQAVGHANWSTTATAVLEQFDYPEIITTSTTGAAILAEQVGAMINGGFKGINAVDVLTTPGNYFINNYWSEADVATYGHIAGAYRINPLTVAGDEIKNQDPDETIVTYCWTGQTSSMITAYLTVLGYDAKSLKYGANGMIYSELTSGKWVESGNYSYVTD